MLKICLVTRFSIVEGSEDYDLLLLFILGILSLAIIKIESVKYSEIDKIPDDFKNLLALKKVRFCNYL